MYNFGKLYVTSVNYFKIVNNLAKLLIICNNLESYTGISKLYVMLTSHFFSLHFIDLSGFNE